EVALENGVPNTDGTDRVCGTAARESAGDRHVVDEFEGDEYERVLIKVKTARVDEVDAYIYQLRKPRE
ncbi:MAG: gamma-glutamylcyclotransferase, partial [Myxococcota bacterium]